MKKTLRGRFQDIINEQQSKTKYRNMKSLTIIGTAFIGTFLFLIFLTLFLHGCKKESVTTKAPTTIVKQQYNSKGEPCPPAVCK